MQMSYSFSHTMVLPIDSLSDVNVRIKNGNATKPSTACMEVLNYLLFVCGGRGKGGVTE